LFKRFFDDEDLDPVQVFLPCDEDGWAETVPGVAYLLHLLFRAVAFIVYF
jgi:hypothetical protein